MDESLKKIKQAIILRKKLKEIGIFSTSDIQNTNITKIDKENQLPTTFTIGKVTTVESDKVAEVTNVGTDTNIVLDFKIPRGTDGKLGPTGPTGMIGKSEKIVIDGIQTIKSDENADIVDELKDNVHHLMFYLPKGEKGDVGPQGLKGEIGESEKIIIADVQTIQSTEEAMITDNFKDNFHHLTFYIPKGEKGETGAGAGSTAFNSILYVGYSDATDSRALTIKEKIFIPESTKFFEVPSTINIDIKVTGIYEITLCGKMSGITETNGAKFFLINVTTGTVINNLTCELKEGTTSDTVFSGTTITQIFAPATFQVKTSISSNTSGSNIKFYDINLIMKRYNI